MNLASLQELFDISSWGPLQWVSQIVGVIALFFLSFSFLQKTRKGILIFQLCGSACWLVNMLLINAVAGAILNVISVIRAVIFLFGEKKDWARHWSWAPILSFAYLGAGILSYFMGDGWTAALPCAALIIATFSFVIKDPFKIRIINFFCCPLWLMYSVLHGNPLGIMNEIVSMTFVLVGIITIDIIGRRRARSETANIEDN